MLSVSFDPEVSSFLWGLLGKSEANVTDSLPDTGHLKPSLQFIPLLGNTSSQFLQFLVLPASLDNNIGSRIQYSAKTAGVLAAAAVSSYCAYSVLTKVRTKLIKKDIVECDRHFTATILRAESPCPSIPSDSSQIVVRPNWLPLSQNVSTALSSGNYLRLAKRLFSHNESVIRIISGEEGQVDDEEYNFDDLQAHYFGPPPGELSDDDAADAHEDNYVWLPPLVAPVSPADSAYTSEYESIARPG